MPQEVTDVRSNPNDQIAHAASVLGGSKQRKMVFNAIYKGKKRIKTVSDIEVATGLTRMRVLQEANQLANNRIVSKVKKNGQLAYEKDQFLTQNKKRILTLAGDKNALEAFPTKVNPRSRARELVIRVPRTAVEIKQLSIDRIDSFSEVKSHAADAHLRPINENAFKEGLKQVLKEEGEFQDWGGETNDLYTTRVIIGGVRLSAAFGLKGRGTTGILTPKKMGHNGDQIQRLFEAPAELLVIQYWNQIDESIVYQMKQFAMAKSASEGRRINFCVIDGWDTSRLVRAYHIQFSNVYK